MNTKLIAEYLYQRRLITEVYPNGLVGTVSDTFNLWDVLTKIAPSLKDEIMARDGKVVFRPDCYDEKTKVLTDRGWVYFKDLTKQDLVAQVTHKNEHEFVKPEKYVEQDYSGDMYHFRDFYGKVDLLVTPNHRMVVEQSGKERVVFAEKLGNAGNDKQKMFRGAKAKVKTNGISPLERVKVAFQADGSYCTGSLNNIRFSFSKERKIGRLKELLSAADLTYKVYHLSDGKVEFNVKCDASEFTKDFSWVNVSTLCGFWCEGFIDELKYWDSSIRSNGRFKFDTTNLKVAEVVELVALSAGCGVLTSFTNVCRSELFNDVHTLHIMTNNKIGGQSWVKDKKSYTGKVYCVKVPTGKIIVKRGRCTMVCGNSGDPVDIICGTAQVPVYSSIDEAIEYELEAVHEEYSENCGQGYMCDDKAEVTVSVGGVVFKLKFSVEVGSMKMDIGDRMYWVESVKHISTKNHTLTNEEKGAIEILWEQFGGAVNEKGFMELDSHVGLIYGDSITLERCEAICERLKQKGFSSGNVVFGVGSYTYQMITRDTFGMAMKATYCEINGEGREIFKDPITDDGVKKSAKGLLMVIEDPEVNEGQLALVDQVLWEHVNSDRNQLKTVFEDGKLLVEQTLTQIRQRVTESFR